MVPKSYPILDEKLFSFESDYYRYAPKFKTFFELGVNFEDNQPTKFYVKIDDCIEMPLYILYYDSES